MTLPRTPEPSTKLEMEQVKLLIHQRGQVKARVTTIIKALEKAEDNPTEVSLSILRVYSKKLETLYNEYVAIHKEILAKIPSTMLEEQDEKFIMFENLHTDGMIRADSLIEHLSVAVPTALTPPQVNPPQVIIQQQPLRAPIPSFDGRYENWPRFKTMFQDIISRCADSDAMKLHHLDKALIGAAAGIIDAKTLADNNYNHAWELLIERFENKRVIIDTYIGGLLSLKKMAKESYRELRELLDTCTRHVEGLKYMDQPIDNTSGLIINKILTSCLDPVTRKYWERSLTHGELPDLGETLKFLNEQCRVLERCETDLPATAKISLGKSSQSASKSVNVKVHASTSADSNESCQFCGGNHFNYQCSEFRKLSVSERIAKVKESRVCFNCLRRGHRSLNCSSKSSCSKCHKRHHSLLHDEGVRVDGPEHTDPKVQEQTVSIQASSSPPQQSSNVESSVSTSISSTCCPAMLPNVLLLTAMVNLLDKSGHLVPCRAFLDCGAQTNLLSISMYKKLGFDGVPVHVDIVGVSSTRSKSNRIVDVNLRSLCSAYKTTLKCLVMETITSPLPCKPIDIAQWNIPSNIQLADPNFHVPAAVDLLIGLSHFFELLKIGHIVLAEGLPELRETELGWVIAGEIHKEVVAIENVQQVNCVAIDALNETIKRFWQIEEVETSPSPHTGEEEECEEFFRSTYRRDSIGRYIVKLPTRDNVTQLSDNRSLALRRFFLLERRLLKDPELHLQYSKFIEEYISLGHCREVIEANDPPGKLKYYMPHHAVYRPTSSSTKLRVVFDASAKSPSGVSLNEVLKVGPVVQKDLLSILLRFRMYLFVFATDILKMYRQILIDPELTSLQRIFWRFTPTDRIKILELLTVTYGTSAAPFLATRSLLQLSIDEGVDFPLAARIIQEDCYVDDILSGARTIEEAIECRRQLEALLERGGFPVHKWCANHEAILHDVPESKCEKLVALDDLCANEVIKTLGLMWNPKTDEFLFRPSSSSDDTVVTKRQLFSEVAKLFDPLGLLSPITVLAKRLMQQTWAVKIDWDEALTENLLTDWLQLRKSLEQVNDIKIPRPAISSDYESLELHGFADASGIAYGACLYVRSIHLNGNCTVRLLCSKSKIAPLQELTIPRKELCAAVLLSRLVKKTNSTLQIQFSTVHLWSDSQIVLAWLRKPSAMLQPFVRNRVVEIVNENQHTQWNYVRSKENPADVVSRGQPPDLLKNNALWWNGPQFLHSHDYEPAVIEEILESELPEMKSSNVCVVNILNVDDLPLFKRFSSFRKLQRVLAYVQRFIRNCREKVVKNRVFDPLPTITELRMALHTIVMLVQHEALFNEIQRVENNEPCKKIGMLGPFLQDGVLRVGGRLQHSRLPMQMKHQYILPKHPITDLIIRAYHEENLHVGPTGLLSALRQRFWLLGSRSAVRKITRRCVRCFRSKPNGVAQYMGNLPPGRVVFEAPFVVTGVDYAGPFLVKQGTRKPVIVKAYISVFVCFTTKSVHLELVSDMTSAAFIAALQRFVCRRGVPREIHSDNGTNFRGAKSELHNLFLLFQDQAAVKNISSFCQSKEISWHFIPPEAPEFGGLWEAAVKSTKYHLKRMLKDTPLTFEEFSTLLVQIEAILNSRPLFSISDDPSDSDVITPSHFLIGRPMTAIPERSYDSIHKNRLSRLEHLQQIREHFWKSWVHDYLVSLQPRGKNRLRFPNVIPGQVVLLEDKSLPPQQWKMGRVVTVYPGSDELVRAVDVRVGETIFRRPINKLSLLPIEDNQ